MSSSSPILFFFLLSTALPFSVHGSGGFNLNLMHRDSPNSPFHNPSLSHSDRLRAAARRSTARAGYFRTSPTKVSVPIDSKVIPDAFEYLMAVSVGMPPFKILSIADTGSDLVWTQCKPCVECYKQKDPIFDPKASSTYGTILCTADSCSELDGACTTNSSLCQYHYSYGDLSSTVGILSTETFTFDSEGGKRNVSVPGILFGCSHESEGTFKESDDGLIGLGRGPLSLVSQLGSSIEHKFSYCLVPYSDDSSSSLLNFGNKANVTGPNAVSTAIIAGDVDTFYYLSLEDISVGGDDENVTFAPKDVSDQGNIIIDSGTTLTILDESIMRSLVDKVSQAVKYPRVEDSDFDLCFNVSSTSSADLVLPEMTFGFSGAPVNLPPMNTFVAVEEGVVCLAIVSSGENGGIRIFGNIAQQNLHIGYDLKARKLTFAPADCAKL